MSKKSIIIVLVLIECCFIFLSYKSLSNKPDDLNKVKLNNEVKKKGFAIMVENDDGNYVSYDGSSFPTNMIYNEDKSSCIDMSGNKINNALTFNSNNTVTLTTNKTAYCTLYFDKPKPSVTLTVSTDGVNNTLPTYNHYKTTLTCDNANALFSTKYQRLEISSMSNSYTKCNLNYTKDSASYTLLSSVVQSNGTQISSTNNAGGTDTSYRYTGKTPSNYVWFNNEMWRIIGLVPVCTASGCTTSENLVKIIRNDSLGGYSYDVSSTATTELKGAWGSNTLYTLLNSYYYGKNNGIDDSSCRGYYASSYTTVKPDCDYTQIGISSDTSDYYGRMVKNVYWNTGASDYNGTANGVYTTETATQTVSGRIGLMSASDYGYAGLYYDTAMDSSTFANYAETNWLYGNGYEWTSTQYSSRSYSALCVTRHGYVSDNSALYGYAVRPVLYLESDVYVISGDGTEANPYILGM